MIDAELKRKKHLRSFFLSKAIQEEMKWGQTGKTGDVFLLLKVTVAIGTEIFCN